jgi:hypothetical protein
LSVQSFSKFSRGGKFFLLVGNLLVAFQFSIRFFDWYASLPAQWLLIYPAGIFFASVVTGFLVMALRDVPVFVGFIIRYTLSLVQHLANADSTSVASEIISHPLSPTRRAFLKSSGTAMLGTTFGAPLISALLTSHEYTIRRVPLIFPNLPTGLNGLTIAQLSDVHSGVYMTEKQIFEIVELVNALHPNIIIHTGDHVDNADNQIPSIVAPTRSLKADYGVFGVLGNHDHFATAEKVSAALGQTGMQLLNNANRLLTINGERLSIVGVDDFSRTNNFARLEDAVRGVKPDSFKLFLSHRPEFFDAARTKTDFDLMLAGHTHGGQVGFEAFGLKVYPVYLVHKYAMGYYQVDDKQLYVNVGVGMVGAPIRYVPAEITIFTLQQA